MAAAPAHATCQFSAGAGLGLKQRDLSTARRGAQ
jgi:hypothetical protein